MSYIKVFWFSLCILFFLLALFKNIEKKVNSTATSKCWTNICGIFVVCMDTGRHLLFSLNKFDVDLVDPKFHCHLCRTFPR